MTCTYRGRWWGIGGDVMAMASAAATSRFGTATLRPSAIESLDFDELYRRYHRRVHGFVRRKIADAHVVDDVVQEVFLRVYRSIDSVDPDRDPWPWLARVADNAAVDALRRRRPVEEMREAIVDGLSTPIRSQDDPAERFTARQRREGIAKAMGTLCDRQRRMLVLREAEGWRYEDIAEFEGITLNALKSALKRARKSFRDAYATVADERGLWGAALAPAFAISRRVRAAFSRAEVHASAPLSGLVATVSSNVASLMVAAGIASASIAMAGATELPASVNAVASRPDASAAAPGAGGSTSATEAASVGDSADDVRRLAAVGVRSSDLTGTQAADVAPDTAVQTDEESIDVLATLGAEAPGVEQPPFAYRGVVECADEVGATFCDAVDAAPQP